MDQVHAVDVFAPFLGRYEALAELIGEGSDPLRIVALLEAINEGFEAKLDEVAGASRQEG